MGSYIAWIWSGTNPPPSSMPQLHIMVALMFLLIARVATGSAELNRTRSPSTPRAPLASGRCKPISLAELQASLLWGTFYERLSVVVLGKRGGDRYLDSVGFKVEAAFEDGSKNAKVCIEGVDIQNIVAPASGEMTFDYPAGLSTVVGGKVTSENFFPLDVPARTEGYSTRCAGVGSPLTEGRIYETSFSVQDVTLPEVDSSAKTVNGLYSDTLENSFGVDVNAEHDASVTISASPGSICSFRHRNTTCIQEAAGEATFRLDGAVRVGFDSPVNEHYYWYLWLDSWAPLVTGPYPWSYSQSKVTITTNGNDEHLANMECHDG
ncbi:hypothetical protein B0H16DRAFT_1468206 [Mycena metata]|uniref:Uncharacterized protein n=1 Tax=Mycena metata TaxID=1033252 RepID=A0AAD7I1T4_9AGAR|nr:hypothetical protein B0H16DRAFT_1468206 [Mycena metata]